MSETVMSSGLFSLQNAKKSLDVSIKSWFAIALFGQWAFATYVFLIYALGLLFAIDLTDISPASGIKKTEGIDRVVFFTHIVPTVYLALFGMFQLVPGIRNRFRGFHRWNGRVFLMLGFMGAVTGLYLQWVRGLTFSEGITVNGVLIVFATFLTWYYAVNKRFDLHMRWAIHTFILVNGVWSFRLYLMGWYMVNQGPNGNTPNVDGPMDVFLSYACFLLPMAIAEVYFWVKKQRSSVKVWSGTLVMTAGALITLIGVAATIMMMWTPRITKILGVM